MKNDAVAVAEKLARDFLGRVWGPKQEIEVIDELMTSDFVIHTGGKEIRGRDAFKAWVAEFFRNMPGALDLHRKERWRVGAAGGWSADLIPRHQRVGGERRTPGRVLGGEGGPQYRD